MRHNSNPILKSLRRRPRDVFRTPHFQPSRQPLIVAIVTALSLLAASVPGDLSAQTSRNDEAVMNLIRQLSSGRLAERNLAEQQLIEAGEPLLDSLPRLQRQIAFTSESHLRLQRIREQIFQGSVDSWNQPSQIQVDETLGTEQLIEAIYEQTGNRVQLPNTEWKSSQSQPFWTTIDTICQANNLAIDPAASNDNTLALSPISEALKPARYVDQQGLLRVEWLEGGNEEFPQARLRLFWEPRIRMLAVRVPMNSLTIKDRQDQDWAQFNKDAIYNISAPRTRNFSNIRLPVRHNESAERAPNRLAMQLNLVSLAPDAVCQFEDFLSNESPSRSVSGRTQHFGMAAVSLASVRLDETQIRVRIRTRYDTAMAQPLRSHTDWGRFCKAEIVLSNDERSQPIESAQILQEPYQYVIQYTFARPKAGLESVDLKFRIPSGIMESTQNVTLGLGDLQKEP